MSPIVNHIIPEANRKCGFEQKLNAVVVKNIVISFQQHMEKKHFCTKPTLDYLVPVVIDHEFVDGSALTIAIWDKITSVTDKIEKENQSVHLHILDVISGTKDDHCFETLLEKEWEVLRHRMIDRMREFYCWTALKQFLIISLIIAIVSILNLQLRIMRARKGTDDQKLTDNFQESEKLLKR
ncbi:hypothetical protein RF11_06605 [Thelohanellus kitauei]|uniref:Uncharacterized protein n=1 Tax=Thelohanellus kitauei TaxID=669202 RepID=A0A0C2MSK7_THEKT|nr:hypothetical protein RF11_06605 [Thelohanellus kitauei]